MLKLKFADGMVLSAASDTVIYPSVNPNLCSSMEIHLTESTSDNFDSFVNFMPDKNNTKAITFQGYYKSGGISELQKETTYLYYQVPVSFLLNVIRLAKRLVKNILYQS